MEILGPQGVTRRQPTGVVLDVVVLAVPFTYTGQELMDGVVVLNVGLL
jgi:hypothetical protein